MNVLIIGDNKINEALKQSLAQQGIGVHMISNIKYLVRLKGGPGFFSATITVGLEQIEEIAAAGVIVTQPPTFDGVDMAIGLQDENLMDKLEDANRAHKIIFLLDYLSETLEQHTAKALESALALAHKGRQVVFFSQHVKTSPYGAEQVYSSARQAGVSFIKYESIDWEYDAGLFKIKVFDGVITSELSSSVLVAAGKENVSARDAIIQKLRLAKDNDGYINGNKFFLGPVHTSRRGVFYFSPGLCQEAKSLDDAVSLIAAELQALETTPSAYAEIEAKKCAFCYTCYRVCPHGALEPDLGPDIETNAMTCEKYACTACGACAAVCPGQAIVIKDTIRPDIDSVENLSDGARSICTTAVNNGPCKVYYCENSGGIAFSEDGTFLEDIALSKNATLPDINIEKLPCGGSIGQEQIAADIAIHDKVLLIVCMDDACRHMVGGKRSCQQATMLADSVKKMGLDDKKIAFIKTSAGMKGVLAEEIQAFLQ